MPNPTRQQIINAHGALSSLTRLADNYLSSISDADGEARQLQQFILRVLPPKPRPTMAEVEWEDDLHYLAEAQHPDYGKVIMLFKNRLDWISCFYQERSALFSEDPSLLTPTGERYTLTEVQE